MATIDNNIREIKTFTAIFSRDIIRKEDLQYAFNNKISIIMKTGESKIECDIVRSISDIEHTISYYDKYVDNKTIGENNSYRELKRLLELMIG